ncbi:hypothetical protein [Thauera humireducens]
MIATACESVTVMRLPSWARICRSSVGAVAALMTVSAKARSTR